MDAPVIQFKRYEVEKINYIILNEDESTKSKMKFLVSGALSDDSEVGVVTLDISLPQKEQKRKIDVIISGYFTFREDLTSDKEKHQYLGVNGTAILLPYLRAIVSMVTVLDKNESIVFPTLNVSELMKLSEEENKND